VLCPDAVVLLRPPFRPGRLVEKRKQCFRQIYYGNLGAGLSAETMFLQLPISPTITGQGLFETVEGWRERFLAYVSLFLEPHRGLSKACTPGGGGDIPDLMALNIKVKAKGR